jgi:nucleotide-binding universal stress UspA family protein
MLATILVPLDGSALAERALPYATAVALAANSSISLLHVTSDVETSHRPQIELDAATRLERLAERLRAQGPRATARTMPGDVAGAIVDAAGTAHADMIVMSTHGRSGLGRWLYGSVADEVLRRAELPILLVSAACDHPWPTDRPLKILVPLDGSETSEAALTPARELGSMLGADLILLRSVEPAAAPNLAFNPEEIRLEMVAPEPSLHQSQDYLEEIASKLKASLRSVDVLVEVGEPATSIAAVARQEKVDMIVMATHGRTGLARLTMGSVALATLHRAHVPVLLVRPASLRVEMAEAQSGTSGTTPPTTVGQ